MGAMTHMPAIDASRMTVEALEAYDDMMVECVIKRQRERPGGGLTLIGTNEPREVAWGDRLVSLRVEG